MRTQLAGTLLILTLSAIARGQTQEFLLLKDLTANLRRTEAEIKKARPETPESTLQCDKNVIASAIPTVEESYRSKGFETSDAQQVSLLAWMRVRVNSPLSPNKCMNATSYMNFVLTWGRLAINSSPDGANIKIDEELLDDKTKKKVWLPAKEQAYTVLLTKPGYKPLELKCKIEDGKETECSGTLVAN
jgi:PEGA domain